MKRRVVVTGLGLVTPCGNDVPTTWSALMKGESGADYIKKFDLKSTMVVNNWIKRGVVPAENIISVGRLNGLKLIKAVPYLSR